MVSRLALSGRSPSDSLNGANGAVIDPTRHYRYHLWRRWSDRAPAIAWIMLNPSTSDEQVNDPTLRFRYLPISAMGLVPILVQVYAPFRSNDSHFPQA